MPRVNVLTPDSRGRVVLPERYKNEKLLEYVDRKAYLIIYPVETVRRFPDMDDLPEETLDPVWKKEEASVTQSKTKGIRAKNPRETLRKLKNRS